MQVKLDIGHPLSRATGLLLPRCSLLPARPSFPFTALQPAMLDLVSLTRATAVIHACRPPSFTTRPWPAHRSPSASVAGRDTRQQDHSRLHVEVSNGWVVSGRVHKLAVCLSQRSFAAHVVRLGRQDDRFSVPHTPTTLASIDALLKRLSSSCLTKRGAHISTLNPPRPDLTPVCAAGFGGENGVCVACAGKNVSQETRQPPTVSCKECTGNQVPSASRDSCVICPDLMLGQSGKCGEYPFLACHNTGYDVSKNTLCTS